MERAIVLTAEKVFFQHYCSYFFYCGADGDDTLTI